MVVFHLLSSLTVLPSRPMSQWICIFLLAFASAAHAAPVDSSNDVSNRWQDTNEALYQWINPTEALHLWIKSKKVTGAHVMNQIDAVRNDVVDKTSNLVATALDLLGAPYRRGGTNAETGFDCSGFVRSIYSQAIGLMLPRSANQQAAATQTIDKKELQPGDLVFFNTMRRTFSHVGIYIGDGKFVHSPRSGQTVRVEDMQDSYWKKRFSGARRVIKESLNTPAN
jgi:cell wall-associated NlpC family hydrolase